MGSDLREAARTAFIKLQLPKKITLEILIGHISILRGKEIQIFETEKLRGRSICGLWIPREEKEVIYHSTTNSPLHRQQMVLHELSHMVLSHDEIDGVSKNGVHVFKALSGELVTRALARGDFRSDQELAAEYLADFLASALRESTNEFGRLGVYFE